MRFVYLLALGLAALGVGAIDARWRLALFAYRRRAVVSVAMTSTALLVIDVAGIRTGNFRLGTAPWMTGIEVADQLPIEELGFVVFLSYVCLVAYAASARILARRRERSNTGAS